MTGTKIFAHRGFSSRYPENTMVAFQASVDIGADGIEFDVQLSKDLVPVVIHDLSLERTTTGKGLVRHFTVSELKGFSAGSWFSNEFKEERIPTLEEILIWAANHSLILNIEVKGNVFERDLIIAAVSPLLKKYDLEDRIILSSFDHKFVHLIQKQDPFLETGVIVATALFQPEEYLRHANVLGYHFSHVSLLEEEVKALIKKGFRLRPYTVNEIRSIRKFIEIGCDAIFTDEVEKALVVRKEWFERTGDF
ncbi:glycerophosphodiester phosphodiesterase [Alkalihalobacillus deserti]|uniref:glycerophosphodiester phosphodiesterase n=1 Tax=Alkalihalobacillus deserti TaxID=2879466 RepID=UPI001D1346BA|nr:glycerophosphodiester phosphodiesterase [Alkalihalobacillus deserti]